MKKLILSTCSVMVLGWGNRDGRTAESMMDDG